MGIDLAAFRSNRAVVVSVVVAAVSVSLLAVIAIAKLLGWVSVHAPSTPMSMATPGNQAAGTVPDLGLAPGETLVAPADAPARVTPMMPRYEPPTPPAPAPAVPDEVPRPAPANASPAPAPTPAPARPAARPPPRATPRTPSFARGDPHPTSPLDPWPNPAYCEHCGRVISTTTYPDVAEVRVRFEDGSTRTLRSAVPSPWHVGDHVRLERGRLVRD